MGTAVVSATDPCLAVIPARGGSRGLPGKNIRTLADLPLIVHSLRCAALVPRLTDVIVSTDDPSIATVARDAGGDVPFMRPTELAGDNTPMMPVLRHALDQMEASRGRKYRSLLLLDPTSPGRTPNDIEHAFTLLGADPTANGVVACSRPTFNPFWVGVVERAGYIAAAFESGRYARRQDVPPFYRINGALYLWRTEFVRSAPDAWPLDKHLMLEIPEQRAFSIDDLAEFEMADLLLRSGRLELPWLKVGT